MTPATLAWSFDDWAGLAVVALFVWVFFKWYDQENDGKGGGSRHSPADEDQWYDRGRP